MNLDGFSFQVIHLWFEDFSIEDSNTCEADVVTLKDELGTIGESCAEGGRHIGKTNSLPCRESEKNHCKLITMSAEEICLHLFQRA